MAFEWDETLETGDPLVDQQHRQIHEMFNELGHAEDTPGEVMRVLDRLTVHVGAHFAAEEDLMKREEYPQHLAVVHLAEHEKLTQRTRTIVLSFHRGELTSIAPIVDFLRDWLTTHVREYDRDLIDYVRARGGAARTPEP